MVIALPTLPLSDEIDKNEETDSATCDVLFPPAKAIVWLPNVAVGTVTFAVNVPRESVDSGAGLVVTVTPSTITAMVAPAGNPVPVTLVLSPTFATLLPLMVTSGVMLAVACAEAALSDAFTV